MPLLMGYAVEAQHEPAPTIELPAVTVIVPTRNRAASLVDTLHNLIAQDYPQDRLELVVVDDDSTDRTAQVVEEAQARSRFAFRYFRVERGGTAAARNYALARTRGDIVGLTDSDCHVGADWVRNAVRRMTPGVGLVTGPIQLFVNPQRVPGFCAHQMLEITQEHPLYPGANVFYRREAIDRLGGFAEHFGPHPSGPPTLGDDTDLAWRIKRAGYRSAFAPDAVVRHEATGMSVKSWLADPLRLQIFPFLVARIPEIRAGLPYRYFMDRHTPVLYLALLGTALATAGKRRWGWAFLLPWAWAMRHWIRRDLWPPQRWWRIPIKYGAVTARHLLLAGTLLWASLRYRAAVL
jgi:GT2 family glycosyltransferase